MSKILVLGGTQFFGKRLIAKLLEAGAEVTLATRGRTADSFGDSVSRVQLERQDRNSVERALQSGEWDIVFDQTCYAPKEAADVWDVLKDQVKRYVLTSSMAVYEYGEDKKEEDFDPSRYPFTMGTRADYKGLEGYRQAKREAEAYLIQEASIPVIAVRFPFVVGPDDYTNRLRFFVDKVGSDTPIGVENPEASLCFISSEEAAWFLKWVGEATWSGPINAASYGTLTHTQLLAHIEAITGKSARLGGVEDSIDPSPYNLPDSWTIDASRAAGMGFDFRHLEDYLPSLLQLYADQRNAAD